MHRHYSVDFGVYREPCTPSTHQQFRRHPHRVNTEWQCPFSAVHYIMMEKNSPSLVWVGGDTLPYFTLSTSTSKVVVHAPAERADALPLFLLYLYVLCGHPQQIPTETTSIRNGHYLPLCLPVQAAN